MNQRVVADEVDLLVEVAGMEPEDHEVRQRRRAHGDQQHAGHPAVPPGVPLRHGPSTDQGTVVVLDVVGMQHHRPRGREPGQDDRDQEGRVDPAAATDLLVDHVAAREGDDGREGNGQVHPLQLLRAEPAAPELAAPQDERAVVRIVPVEGDDLVAQQRLTGEEPQHRDEQQRQHAADRESLGGGQVGHEVEYAGQPLAARAVAAVALPRDQVDADEGRDQHHEDGEQQPAEPGQTRAPQCHPSARPEPEARPVGEVREREGQQQQPQRSLDPAEEAAYAGGERSPGVGLDRDGQVGQVAVGQLAALGPVHAGQVVSGDLAHLAHVDAEHRCRRRAVHSVHT